MVNPHNHPLKTQVDSCTYERFQKYCKDFGKKDSEALREAVAILLNPKFRSLIHSVSSGPLSESFEIITTQNIRQILKEVGSDGRS